MPEIWENTDMIYHDDGEYVIVKHTGDGEYDVLGWRTTLAVEPWAVLRKASAASLCELEEQHPHIRVVEVPGV